MNGLCGIEWGVFTLEGASMATAMMLSWNGLDTHFAAAMATATYVAIAVAVDAPRYEHSRRKIKLPLPLMPPQCEHSRRKIKLLLPLMPPQCERAFRPYLHITFSSFVSAAPLIFYDVF